MSSYPPRTKGVLSALIEMAGYPDQGQAALAMAALAVAPAAYIRAVGLVAGRLEQTCLRTPGQAAHQCYDYAAPAVGFECGLIYDQSGLVLDQRGIAVRASRAAVSSPG